MPGPLRTRRDNIAKQSAAKSLFLTGENTLEIIAKKVGVGRNSVFRWCREGNWKAERAKVESTVESIIRTDAVDKNTKRREAQLDFADEVIAKARKDALNKSTAVVFPETYGEVVGAGLAAAKFQREILEGIPSGSGSNVVINIGGIQREWGQEPKKIDEDVVDVEVVQAQLEPIEEGK